MSTKFSPALPPRGQSGEAPDLTSSVPFDPAWSIGAPSWGAVVGVPHAVVSNPGLISRAMGERDEKLLPRRTPAGSVLRCAPLAAESAQGARGRSPLQPGSPGAPALLDLVRYTPLAALPVGRIRA